jgi:membrane fusion protein, multidrug efflux system
MGQITSRIAILCAATLLTGGVFAQPPGPRATSVETVEVRAGTVRHQVHAVGSLRADESVVMRFEIPGRIAEIRFTEGETIAQGSELIALDATELRARLAESSAAVKLDTLSFERAQDLLKKELISRQQYDEAVATLSASRARQAVDEARLAQATLRAPFNGVLGLRHVSPGEYVQPGQEIVGLDAIDPLKVDFRIPEAEGARLRTGQPLLLRVDAFPGREIAGHVYAIAPRVDEATRTVAVRGQVPNPGHELRPGMFARVALVIEERTDALLIPEEAVVPAAAGQFVFRVADGHAVRTPVILGRRQGGEVEVLRGLSPGDRVVTAGQTKIGDGAPVTVLPPPTPQAPLAAGG